MNQKSHGRSPFWRRSEPERRAPTLAIMATTEQSLLFLDGFPEFLAELGWEVHIVSGPGSRLATYQSSPAVHGHEVDMTRHPSLFRDLRSLRVMIHTIAAIRPDIVLAGTPKASLLGMVASVVLRVPNRVYHVLGLRLETTDGPLRKLLLITERITVACSTRVLSVSPSLSSAILALGLAPEEKIDLIGHGSSNGVDTAHFDSERLDPLQIDHFHDGLGLDHDAVTIGFVGRIVADKGLSELASALEEISEQGTKVQLLLVGDTEGSEYRPFTDASYRVVRTGPVNDVRSCYAAMDILCLPTYREGLPNVCLEAAAMGLPVVTTLATGAVDSIIDGDTGLAVPPGNAHALASAISYLARNKDLASEMGRRGRRWVTAHFERRGVWRDHEAYLRALVERNLRANL